MNDNTTDFSDPDNDFTWKIKDTEITYRTKTPKTVNQYLLGEVLGKGSYGKVREALDTTNLERVAIKIVKKQLLRKLPGGVEESSIKQEITIMKNLNHQHVVKMLESFFFEEKGKLYIVLEYVGGGTLQDLLDRASNSRLPLKQAQSFFRDLVLALHYIHGEGVVHRDIKPGNLMITLEGILKVSDFGVAERLSAFDDSSYCSKTQGSPAFQPPEIASGAERFSGVKGDVWAAGISLFYIVTGQYPFAGNTVYTLFENIARAEYVIPPALQRDHPQLALLITGMLEPDKNKRLTVSDIINHQWLQGTVHNDNDEEPVDIVASRTLFTPEFIMELSKIKTDEGKSHTGAVTKKKRYCFCILV